MTCKDNRLLPYYYTFVDDKILLMYSGINLETMRNTVNSDIKMYSQWVLVNKVKMNV